MSMHNLTKYSNSYAKIQGSLWQYHKGIPNDNIVNSGSFKYKARLTRSTSADGNTRNVRTVVTLKYWSNF